jgi:glycosyltransferase involved in cell wall biosynthesis
MSTVSVIIPAYNSGLYIGQAIDSLLMQKRPPDQIIIVNDGSSDNTRAIVRKYEDPRLVYVEQENRGISAARNRGLSLAASDYIGFLDSDDRWRPTMLEKQLAVLEGNSSIVCSFTNFVRFEEKSKRELGDQFRYYPLKFLKTIPGPIINSYVLANDSFCDLVSFNEIPCFVGVTLFRGKSIAGLRFNEALYMGEDYDFLLRVYLLGRVAYIREVLADVRRHGANITEDYLYAAIYRLQGLRSIATAVVKKEHQIAYRDRLVKGYIDAAMVHCRRGQFITSLSTYCHGFSIPGSRKRKLKGLFRIMFESYRTALSIFWIRGNSFLKGMQL